MTAPRLRRYGRGVTEQPNTSLTAPIVVGIDGSRNSLAALHWALDYAAATGRTQVHAVMSWNYPASAVAGSPLGVGLPPTHAMAEATESALAGVLDDIDVPDGVVLTPVVAEGAPAAVISECAADAELIVVGQRGHGGFLGLLLGSVATQVAHHAPCPVVIVPATND